MKLYCREAGGHVVNVRFKPVAGERYCPIHGCQMSEDNPAKLKSRGSSFGAGVSQAEKNARDRFNAIVCTYSCFFKRHREGHTCTYPLDAHHLVPKQFIRQRFSELPEEELLAILFNPLVGAPLCRTAHDAVERGTDHIYWEELSPERIRFVGGLPDFMLLRLEEECPKREAVS